MLGKGSRGSRGSEGTLRRALQPRAGAFEATLRPRDRVRWDPDFQSGEGDLFALTSEGQASRRKPHKRPRASAPGCGCFRDRPRHVGALLRSARFWTWVGAPTFRAVCVPVARTGNARRRWCLPVGARHAVPVLLPTRRCPRGVGAPLALPSEGQASRKKPHKRARASAPGFGSSLNGPVFWGRIS